MSPSPLSEEFLKSSSGCASGIVLMISVARDLYAIKPMKPAKAWSHSEFL